MSEILVTGGLGFIGSHLVERLMVDGHRVTVCDNMDETLYEKTPKVEFKDSTQGIRHRHLDVSSAADMEELFDHGQYQPDAIYHLAAIAGVRPSLRDPGHYAQVNVVGTTRILKWADLVGCKRVFYASSSSVYGALEPPFREYDELTKIMSPYALSKRQGELACDYYAREYDMHTISMRFFTVYGPRQRPDMFIRRAIQLVMDGGEITLYGDGSSYRDYTYVSDIVDGMVRLLDYEPTYGHHEVFNFGCGQKTGLLELVQAIEEAVGKPANVLHIEDQKGDVPGTLARIELAQDLLGYKPQVPVSEGVPLMVDWVRERL